MVSVFVTMEEEEKDDEEDVGSLEILHLLL